MLAYLQPFQRFVLAGDEELGTLEDHSQLLQRVEIERSGPSGLHDPLCTSYADAGYTQQHFVRGAVDLNGELLPVVNGPAALGVQQRVEVRHGLIQ